jgi:hypothetical protein
MIRLFFHGDEVVRALHGLPAGDIERARYMPGLVLTFGPHIDEVSNPKVIVWRMSSKLAG